MTCTVGLLVCLLHDTHIMFIFKIKDTSFSHFHLHMVDAVYNTDIANTDIYGNPYVKHCESLITVRSFNYKKQHCMI